MPAVAASGVGQINGVSSYFHSLTDTIYLLTDTIYFHLFAKENPRRRYPPAWSPPGEEVGGEAAPAFMWIDRWRARRPHPYPGRNVAASRKPRTERVKIHEETDQMPTWTYVPEILTVLMIVAIVATVRLFQAVQLFHEMKQKTEKQLEDLNLLFARLRRTGGN
jgi:hypothetical protein